MQLGSPARPPCVSSALCPHSCMSVLACMNGVPTGLPSVSGKAPSVTRMSPPGKSATPVLVRGMWKSGLFLRGRSQRSVVRIGRRRVALAIEAWQRRFRQADRVREQRVVERVAAVAIEAPDARAARRVAGVVAAGGDRRSAEHFVPDEAEAGLPADRARMLGELTHPGRVRCAGRADGRELVDRFASAGEAGAANEVRVGVACRIACLPHRSVRRCPDVPSGFVDRARSRTRRPSISAPRAGADASAPASATPP